MTTYWNAEVYDRIGTPMRGWAQQVIDDLALTGDETVLDAGCGSGSVTFDLLKKLPRGRIYAVDASAEMIASLQRAIDERGVTNVVPIHASLTDFTLPEPVDAVFSNAVFHWIPDDDALFGCLHRATKPGGRLRAQCGGIWPSTPCAASRASSRTCAASRTARSTAPAPKRSPRSSELAGATCARHCSMRRCRSRTTTTRRSTSRRFCYGITSPACRKRIETPTHEPSSKRPCGGVAHPMSPTTCVSTSGRRSSLVAILQTIEHGAD